MATSNIHEVTARMERAGEGLEGALVAELARLAGIAASQMRARAPKWQSQLTNSIKPTQVSPEEWHIGPAVDYALPVEEGRKPGKGLPRWGDPAAGNIVAWLDSHAFKGRRRSRSATGKAKERNELRDRYQGLSWHVRHFGVAAHPFAAPTAEQMRRIFAPRMEQAGREYLASSAGGAGASA